MCLLKEARNQTNNKKPYAYSVLLMSLLWTVEFIFATCTHNFGECLVIIFFLGFTFVQAALQHLSHFTQSFLRNIKTLKKKRKKPHRSNSEKLKISLKIG